MNDELLPNNVDHRYQFLAPNQRQKKLLLPKPVFQCTIEQPNNLQIQKTVARFTSNTAKTVPFHQILENSLFETK